MTNYLTGAGIRKQRVRLGLSLRETAEQAGMSTVRLGEIERGVVIPTPNERNDLSRVFIIALAKEKP